MSDLLDLYITGHPLDRVPNKSTRLLEGYPADRTFGFWPRVEC
jgi:hypothetical protein